jgi:hypothetical protein
VTTTSRSWQSSPRIAGARSRLSGGGKEFDGILLKLIELCARVEAILIAVARAVLALKKAILAAPAALAKAIAAAKEGAKHIPVIGATISDVIANVVEPLFAAARKAITEIVTKAGEIVWLLRKGGQLTISDRDDFWRPDVIALLPRPYERANLPVL